MEKQQPQAYFPTALVSTYNRKKNNKRTKTLQVINRVPWQTSSWKQMLYTQTDNLDYCNLGYVCKDKFDLK